MDISEEKFLMKFYAKMFNIIIANQLQECIRYIIHPDQSLHTSDAVLVHHKKCNSKDKQTERKETNDPLIRC